FSRSAWLVLVLGAVVWAMLRCVTCHFDRIHLDGEWRNLNIGKFCGDFWGEISAPPLKLSATRGRLRFTRASFKFARDDMVKWFVSILVFTVLTIGINHENFFSRFDSGVRLEQKSVNDRVSYFSEVKQVIQDDFWFGVGAGNYTLEVMKNDRLQRPVWEYQPVHNVFLLVFSELGLIGFILFISILTSLLIKSGFEVVPVFVALFVFMTLDHWIWTSHFGILFFGLILGLVFVDKGKSN
ncbi:O-antigen ligase family protein, partial [Patescibacteria group bacterium]